MLDLDFEEQDDNYDDGIAGWDSAAVSAWIGAMGYPQYERRFKGIRFAYQS